MCKDTKRPYNKNEQLRWAQKVKKLHVYNFTTIIGPMYMHNHQDHDDKDEAKNKESKLAGLQLYDSFRQSLPES